MGYGMGWYHFQLCQWGYFSSLISSLYLHIVHISKGSEPLENFIQLIRSHWLVSSSIRRESDIHRTTADLVSRTTNCKLEQQGVKEKEK